MRAWPLAQLALNLELGKVIRISQSNQKTTQENIDNCFGIYCVRKQNQHLRATRRINNTAYESSDCVAMARKLHYAFKGNIKEKATMDAIIREDGVAIRDPFSRLKS